MCLVSPTSRSYQLCICKFIINNIGLTINKEMFVYDVEKDVLFFLHQVSLQVVVGVTRHLHGELALSEMTHISNGFGHCCRSNL